MYGTGGVSNPKSSGLSFFSRSVRLGYRDGGDEQPDVGKTGEIQVHSTTSPLLVGNFVA